MTDDRRIEAFFEHYYRPLMKLGRVPIVRGTISERAYRLLDGARDSGAFHDMLDRIEKGEEPNTVFGWQKTKNAKRGRRRDKVTAQKRKWLGFLVCYLNNERKLSVEKAIEKVCEFALDVDYRSVAEAYNERRKKDGVKSAAKRMKWYLNEASRWQQQLSDLLRNNPRGRCGADEYVHIMQEGGLGTCCSASNETWPGDVSTTTDAEVTCPRCLHPFYDKKLINYAAK